LKLLIFLFEGESGSNFLARNEVRVRTTDPQERGVKQIDTSTSASTVHPLNLAPRPKAPLQPGPETIEKELDDLLKSAFGKHKE